MTATHLSLTRRELLRAATITGALVASPALMGCAEAPLPSYRSVSSPIAGSVVMVIRHGEKPAKSAPADGIDLRGRPDNHSLTHQGWTRAAYLVDLFSAQPGTGIQPGTGRWLPQPGAIYASGPGTSGDGDVEGTRSRQTVGALAAVLGLPVITTYSRGQESELARAAAAQNGPVLICWQHQSIPAIAAAFTPSAPSGWPDQRYDLVWTFTPTTRGWRFDAIPELLLPGDSR